MSQDSPEKIEQCRERIEELRARADIEIRPGLKAEIRKYEAQWSKILDAYQLLNRVGRQVGDANYAPADLFPSRIPAGQATLAELLNVLVYAAIAHADGDARAAFYLSDKTGKTLHHVVGMSNEYARHVDGFIVGERSLACGLAVARRQAILTQDVSEEPRWQPWLWLAETFHYRACWSFPITSASGKALGSFAWYYPKPRIATARDLDMASVLTRTAAAIIASH